jgi:hypothetical protein
MWDEMDMVFTRATNLLALSEERQYTTTSIMSIDILLNVGIPLITIPHSVFGFG